MLGLGSSLLQGGALRSIVKSGLQLFYKADRTQAPPNSIKDHSRNSNDGVLYSGKALDLDPGTGAVDYVYLRPSNEMGIGPSGFTFAIWFNADTSQSNANDLRMFTARREAGSSYFAVLLTNNGYLKVYFRESGALPSITISTNYRDDNWHRLVISAGPTEQKIYIDGQEVGSDNITLATDPSSDVAYLGAGITPSASTSLKCKLSDFQIYDKVWSSTDVEFDYNNPDKDIFNNPNSSISATDCKSLLRLNEGAGDRVYDAAPVLGVEEVENGNFSTDSDWNVGTGWDIDEANNKATHTGTGGIIKQTLSDLIVGEDYIASVTLNSIGDTSLSNTSFQIRNNADTTSIAQLLSSSGNILANSINYLTLNFTATQVNHIIRVYSQDDIFVTDFSIKQLKPAESFSIVGDKNFVHQQPRIPQYAMSSFSKKMLFDGSNDYVSCGSDASIDNIFSGGGTLSIWISAQSDGENNFGTVISKNKFRLRTISESGGGVTIEFLRDFNSSNGNWTSDSVVLLNKLNHIAVVYDSSSPSNDPVIYVNGFNVNITEDTTPSGTIVSDESDSLIIGNVTASSDNSYDGIIDEVSLFDAELTQTEVLELFNSGSAYDSTTHSQSSNLNAYWRNNGAAQWDDLSTNTNHGTVSGSPAEIFLQEVPFFGKDSLGMFMNKPRLGGLNFNGSGYVNGGNHSSIKPASALSVECWIRTPDVSATSKYVSDADGSASRFFLMQTGSKARFQIDGTYINSAANLTNNTWHYIAGTWNGSTMTLYVDERTPVTVSKSGSITYNTDDLYIGTRLGTGEFYDGIIDDVRIYNKALTQAEISKNYNATKGKHKN